MFNIYSKIIYYNRIIIYYIFKTLNKYLTFKQCPQITTNGENLE